ncbi:ganglioside-induced differentiation-associated protein 2-like [Sinocyclocheilus rhinocerous]|uniref:ganglioside-induced differentiation-associated protein 2-like n=1 Tax=Sinocyclocheilus rhinocerous TaxID=307959 RepID=UPI0007B905D9|nr:PREDICTED: ganglioside-induced differentiation-associated protein 2-like [Sinocyclocheilus rhinocerous]
MEGDVDKQRKLILQGQMSEAAQQKQHQRNYNRWLCRARAEDLSDIAALKALYETGQKITTKVTVSGLLSIYHHLFLFLSSDSVQADLLSSKPHDILPQTVHIRFARSY